MKKLLLLFFCTILSFGYIMTVQASPLSDIDDGQRPLKKSELKAQLTGIQLNTQMVADYDSKLNTSPTPLQNQITNGGGDVIISNLGESEDDYAIGDPEFIYGQSFRTDVYKYNLESVTLNIEESAGAHLLQY